MGQVGHGRVIGLLFLGFSVINLFQTKGYFQKFCFTEDYKNLNANSTYPQHEGNELTAGVLSDSAPYDDADKSLLDLCRREEIFKGSWVGVRKESPPYVPKNEHLRCYPDKAYLGPTWETHQWQPHATHCIFSEWNRSDFCSLMTLGTILVAGDSLSWEQYSSLGQLLGLRVHQTSQFLSKNQNHVQYGCNKQSRLVFRRDDILSDLTSTILETFPQVIVLNRGAHYQNDTALMSGIRHNIVELQEWKAKCKASGMKCHLFWRTSVPGHPLCNQINFTQPNNDLVAMEAWIENRSNYDDHTIKYHWYDYQHQNNLILDALRRGLGYDGFEVLDAYYLNILRPDEHRVRQGDCLHNCYPGKMDVYNQLLLHFLRVQRTQADVDVLQQLYARAKARTALAAANVSTQQLL